MFGSVEGRQPFPLDSFDMIFYTEIAHVENWHFVDSFERFLADLFILLINFFVHDVMGKGHFVEMFDQPFCAFLALELGLVLDVFAMESFFVIEYHLFQSSVVSLSRMLLRKGVSFLLLPLYL